MAAMAVTSQPEQKSACFDLPAEFVEGSLDILDLQEAYMGASRCDETTAWMTELWDREDASGASASSLMDGTEFEIDLDCSSVEASEDTSVDRARSSPSQSDTAASLDKAGASSCHAEVVTWEARLPLSLQLDYSSVLSAWKGIGGTVQEPTISVPISAVSIKLPAPGAGNAALMAAFGSYALNSCSHGPFIGSDAGSAPTSPTALSSHREVPMFVPVGMAQHDSRMDGDMIPTQNIFGSVTGPRSLMPVIPTGSNGSDWFLLAGGAAPVALKGGEIKSADARSARAACALRCKQKKSCRQVVKVRYEMRKINAEQRPRFKGRFVKRDTMSSQDSLAQTSESSASELTDVQWLV